MQTLLYLHANYSFRNEYQKWARKTFFFLFSSLINDMRWRLYLHLVLWCCWYSSSGASLSTKSNYALLCVYLPSSLIASFFFLPFSSLLISSVWWLFPVKLIRVGVNEWARKMKVLNFEVIGGIAWSVKTFQFSVDEVSLHFNRIQSSL